MPGYIVSILSYCVVSDEEAARLVPKVVHVDAQNRPTSTIRF